MEKQALLNTYVNNVDMSETICAIEEMIAVSYTHLTLPTIA